MGYLPHSLLEKVLKQDEILDFVLLTFLFWHVYSNRASGEMMFVAGQYNVFNNKNRGPKLASKNF